MDTDQSSPGTLRYGTRPVRRARISANSLNTWCGVGAAPSGPESDTDTDSSDCYTDSDQESRSEMGVAVQEHAMSQSEPSLAADSETEEIYDSIARFRAEGPAKPNHTVYTKKLWQREGEFWQR